MPLGGEIQVIWLLQTPIYISRKGIQLRKQHETQ